MLLVGFFFSNNFHLDGESDSDIFCIEGGPLRVLTEL